MDEGYGVLTENSSSEWCENKMMVVYEVPAEKAFYIFICREPFGDKHLLLQRFKAGELELEIDRVMGKDAISFKPWRRRVEDLKFNKAA